MRISGPDGRFGRIFLDGWRPYAWIAAAVLALYLKSAFFGFTFFDDEDLIVRNMKFLSDISNVFRAFCLKLYPLGQLNPYYRPLLAVSFILDAQIGGASPAAYHVTNILLHAAVSSLVFALFAALGFRRAVSFFFALAFAVHPALVQAVAWVPGRNDSMLALFSVASFISFLKFVDGGKRRWYARHMVLLLAALFTKESAAITVAVCYMYLALVRGAAALRKDARALLIGHAAVLAAWLVPRYLVTKGSAQATLFDIWHLVVPQAPAVLQLIGKAFFPVRQSVFPVMSGTSCLYGLAGLAVIGALILSCPRAGRGMMAFGASWLILFLIPPLLRPHAPVIGDVLEHRLYMPVIGLMIMLMGSGPFSKAPAPKYAVALGLAVLSAFFIKASAHIENFRDAAVFWESAVKTSPRSAFCHMKLGGVYYGQDRLDEARAHMERALALDPYSSIGGHYYLGHIFLKKGLAESSEREFRKAIALMPENDWALLSLGVVCYKGGRTEEAERCWKKSLEINPGNLESLRNMAILCAGRGDRREAMSYVGRLKALGVEPPREFTEKLGAG